MLTICIELNGIVVAMLIGVAHARLECACKTKVHWQIDNVVAMLPTNVKGIVLGAVIDDNIVNSRRIATQVFNSRYDIISFVICRNNSDDAPIS